MNNKINQKILNYLLAIFFIFRLVELLKNKYICIINVFNNLFKYSVKLYFFNVSFYD